MLSNEFILQIECELNNSYDINTLNLKFLTEKLLDEEHRLLLILKNLDTYTMPYLYTVTPYRDISRIISKNDIENFITVVGIIKNMYMNAKICDLIWIISKDYQYGEKAYNGYLNITAETGITQDIVFHSLIRAFNIAKSMKKESEELKKILDLVKKFFWSNPQDTTAKSLYLIKMFVDEKLQDDILIELCNSKINNKKIDLNFNIYDVYLEVAEKLYCNKYKMNLNKLSDNNDLVDIRRRKGDLYIKEARNSENSFQYIHNIKEAVKILKKIPNTEMERINLIKEIEPIQKKSIESMHKLEERIDFTEEVKKILSYLEGENIKSSIKYLVFGIQLSDKEKLRKRITDNLKNDITYGLMPPAYVNKEGKLLFKLPSLLNNTKEEDINSYIEHEIIIECNFYSQVYINPMLNEILKKHDINENVILKITQNNIFIPQERVKAFTKGILAGFNYDFLTSLNILVPQVENAIRKLAKECGDIDYKNNDEGIEEVKTLNLILESPYLKDCLESDLIFYLKAIFTSKYGLNIRNNLAHGLLDDSDFNTTFSIFTWWFIFRLCCMNSSWILTTQD
ncbi:hypothetical protein psyc5s11_36420 [Clostridium gelidum]|uniref:DUF4209 domain-containing protein n=1 Tax=Clostridium gelidum TaxID=704125 RepID=A0ABM7T7C2_9CLOT|nr:DUF4209 domain-containing protein [Clostridium gelidum]BCZ47575.1 hypothetical protein psyc5s11_36420 [Clostridium gelidum]